MPVLARELGGHVAAGEADQVEAVEHGIEGFQVVVDVVVGR